MKFKEIKIKSFQELEVLKQELLKERRDLFFERKFSPNVKDFSRFSKIRKDVARINTLFNVQIGGEDAS